MVTKGAVWGDYDNDGYPDLYLSNVFGENMLFHNNGNGTFTEVGKKLGVEKPIISFPTWFFDYDNDGWLDIFVASYPNSISEFVKYYLHMPAVAETMELYHNNGNGTFTDVTKQVGLDRVVPAMGANFGDLDNDGYLDMYLGTGTPSFSALIPNVMLKNVNGERFVDVTEATGTGHLQKGHGIAFVDIDNDGDEDVVLNNGGAVPGDNYGEALYENPGAGPGNHWLSLKLVGVKTNRAAIGAKIRVHLKGEIAGLAAPLPRSLERRVVRRQQPHAAHRPRQSHRRVARNRVADEQVASGVQGCAPGRVSGDPRVRQGVHPAASGEDHAQARHAGHARHARSHTLNAEAREQSQTKRRAGHPSSREVDCGDASRGGLRDGRLRLRQGSSPAPTAGAASRRVARRHSGAAVRAGRRASFHERQRGRCHDRHPAT